MNKLIIALVVVLIGIQSWTLKTQQQILEVVTPQIEIEVELENETNEKVNFASEDQCDWLLFRAKFHVDRAKYFNDVKFDFTMEESYMDSAENFAVTWSALCD